MSRWSDFRSDEQFDSFVFTIVFSGRPPSSFRSPLGVFLFDPSFPHDLRDSSELDGTVLPSSCGPYQNPPSSLSPCTTSGTCNTRAADCGRSKYVSPFSEQVMSEKAVYGEKIMDLPFVNGFEAKCLSISAVTSMKTC